MKKLYLAVSIFAMFAFLGQLSYIITGISERGLTGVNYGRVIPFLISIVFFSLYRKE